MITTFRNVAVTVIVMAGISIACFITFQRVATRHWEETLIGPFYGTNYNGHIDGLPSSSLQISNDLHLKINWVTGLDGPILSLGSSNGSNSWSRLLILERTASDGTPRVGRINQIDLKRINPYQDGFKVLVYCDWYWGGKERGLIYLGKDYSFRHISLDW